MLIERVRHCFRYSDHNGNKKDKDLCPHRVYILISTINTPILIESYKHVFFLKKEKKIKYKTLNNCFSKCFFFRVAHVTGNPER